MCVNRLYFPAGDDPPTASYILLFFGDSPLRVAIIVQARMGSERLPGKVMVPIGNKPLIGHLLESLLHCKATSEIIVATTRDPLDDAIVAYCDQQDLVSYRGEESNVASRFYELAASHTWDAFVRVSADSPLLDHQLIDQAISLFGSGPFDLVTNIFPRTFPHGQSVELLRTETFLKDYSQMRTATELEHVTSFFYSHASDYAIHNLTSQENFSHLQMAVDFPQDLEVAKSVVGRMQRPIWTYSLKERIRFWEQEQRFMGRQAA